MTNLTQPNPFDLTGSTALITGAAGLLGAEHAHALLSAGANVVLTDISTDALDKLCQDLTSLYPNRIIKSIIMDVTLEDSVYNASSILSHESIIIDILINNAAINPKVEATGLTPASRLEVFSTKSWDLELAVGLKGAFICSKVFGTIMASNNSGCIINIASDLSVIAPNQSLYKEQDVHAELQPVKPVTYSVIKAGLVGLTKYLSTYWADSGVRCNSLSPGGVYNNQPSTFLQKINQQIPLGRMASPDEYRASLIYLCSSASSYLNGHNLVVDGGRSVW